MSKSTPTPPGLPLPPGLLGTPLGSSSSITLPAASSASIPLPIDAADDLEELGAMRQSVLDLPASPLAPARMKRPTGGAGNAGSAPPSGAGHNSGAPTASSASPSGAGHSGGAPTAVGSSSSGPHAAPPSPSSSSAAPASPSPISSTSSGVPGAPLTVTPSSSTVRVAVSATSGPPPLPGASSSSSFSSGVPTATPAAPITASAANRVPAALRRVAVWVPDPSERTLGEVLGELLAVSPGEPFAPDAVAAAERFSRRLMADPISKKHPELMTLGFFMRKSELARAAAERAAAAHPDVIEVPVGLVFHVPPANVDTIFMYSWLQSLLAGNLNLVRLSARSSPVVEHLCRLLCDVLSAPELAAVRARTSMIQYGHDDAITAAISAQTSLRVIWGGDATIAAIRKSPLPPHGRDLPFPDRFSLVALAAHAVVDSGRSELIHLVEQLYNDLYWFDQAGCSSPRLCLWLGSPEEITAARERLWPALAAHAAQRGYHPDLAMRLAKDVFCHRAVLDGPVTAREIYGPALTVLTVSSLEGLGREHPGAGLLFEAAIDSLLAIEPWLTRKDQTLATFGIPRDDLAELARRLAGRGLDRIVPVGQALQMARFWDGYDLAAEMVRRVHLPG